MKFDIRELDTNEFYPVVGEYYGYGPDYVIWAPKYHFPVTPKKNFKLFRERKPYYWVPNASNDFNLICPDIVPDFPACGINGGVDSFGVMWIQPHPDSGMPSFVKPGNPLLQDIENWKEVIQFPDVEIWDWKSSGKMYMDGLDSERPNCGILLSGFFERLISLMDFEGAAMALVEDPDSVNELMERICDYNICLLEHYKKYYHVDAVIIHDDWGSQRAPFFSRHTLQETILPHFTRFNKRAHELSVFVIHHSCGNSGPFIEDMITCGSDAWQVQVNANENLPELVAKYGDKFFFDPYGYIVPPEITEEGEARHLVEEAYKQNTANNCTFYSAGSEDFEAALDFNAIAYEAARKICTGEL